MAGHTLLRNYFETDVETVHIFLYFQTLSSPLFSAGTTRVYVRVYVHVYACMCRPEMNTVIILRVTFSAHWTWSSLIQLDWQASTFQGSPVSTSPACRLHLAIFTEVLKIKLVSLCLHRKHFTDWATYPAPEVIFKYTVPRTLGGKIINFLCQCSNVSH